MYIPKNNTDLSEHLLFMI